MKGGISGGSELEQPNWGFELVCSCGVRAWQTSWVPCVGEPAPRGSEEGTGLALEWCKKGKSWEETDGGAHVTLGELNLPQMPGWGVEVGSSSHGESETHAQVRARAGEYMFPSFRREGSPYA